MMFKATPLEIRGYVGKLSGCQSSDVNTVVWACLDIWGPLCDFGDFLRIVEGLEQSQ